MRAAISAVVVVLAILPAAAGAQYRTLDDRFPAPAFTSRAEWDARAAWVREHVLASAGLLPLPDKTPLNPVVFDELKHPDYTVSKVYFESLPGFFVTGNLYRPVGEGPFPAVLSAHGHWTYGRLENSPLVSGPGRAITLARQGFVVFSYDMVGYNDSRQLTHTFGGPREHQWGLSLAGLQLWNSIRSLDFLESLPYVKRDAIGITGESGGGTQTFLLAAADARVAAAVPVNMISLHMQGGCLCENLPGLRLDTNNVEIAATIAPRPMLMISATGDWTAETLEVEYPAARALYALLGAQDRVHAVRFTAEHNYNKDSREAMYGWMARWLKGASSAAPVPERSFTPDALPALLVFHGRPLPDRAITAGELTASWIAGAKRQLAQTPLSVRAAALRHALGFAHEAASKAPAVHAGAPPSRPGCGDDAGCRRRAAEGRPHRSRHHVHAVRPGRRRQGPALRDIQPDRRQPARGGHRRGASRRARRDSRGRRRRGAGRRARIGHRAAALRHTRRRGIRHQPRRRLPEAPLHPWPSQGW